MTYGLHVCSPRLEWWSLRILPCATCRCRRKMLVRYYEWYGPSATCLTCGDRWNDGEREQRPTGRYWRHERVREEKAWIKEQEAMQ